MEPLPDFETLSDAALERLIDELTKQEAELSYERGTVQGRLDILRAERRARMKGGPSNHVQLEELPDILSRSSDIDAHTGLHNRHYFHEALAREVVRAQRYERSLALILFDLDDFGEVNDRLGHLAGDIILSRIGERLRSVVRSSDIACRVGGDEFAVILPESTLEDAEQLRERLQSQMTLQPIPHVGRIQISAGIALLRAQDEAASLFGRADDDLNRVKRRLPPPDLVA